MKIPGINSKNVSSLMGKVENLFDLFQMSEEEINKIIENSKNAKTIYEFVNKSIKNDGQVGDSEFGFEDVNDFYVAEDKQVAAASTAAAANTNLLKVGGSGTGRGKYSKRGRR